MRHEKYESVQFAGDLSSFDFTSVGKNGEIKMRIGFIPTEVDNIYVLAFGPLIGNGKIDDKKICDNGDTRVILATLATTVDVYTERYPDRMIYFQGSTTSRTRLYRMAIGLNLEELSRRYTIYGDVETEENWVLFSKNLEINAFLIKRSGK